MNASPKLANCSSGCECIKCLLLQENTGFHYDSKLRTRQTEQQVDKEGRSGAGE